jgi:tetratricopeptide (TPR) repeat protein
MKNIFIKIDIGFAIKTLLLVPFILVLSTVFITNNSLVNGITSGKYFCFYETISGVAMSSILIFFLQGKRRLRFNKIDIFVLLYSLAVFLLMPKTDEISQKQILLPLIFCLYFYFRLILNNFRLTSFVLSLFFMSTGLIEAVLGLTQLYGWTASHHNLFKITGTFFNPGPYSGYVAMIVPMALYYAISDRKLLRWRYDKRILLFWIRWTISIITVTCALLILPASMSRAAWIGLLCGCGLALCYFFSRNKRYKDFIRNHQKRVCWIALSVFLVLSVSLTGMYHLKKDSADGRTLIWKISLSAIPGYPLGSGLNTFSGVYGNAQAAYFEKGEYDEQEERVAGNPEYAFNEYLQICIEQGIIPFVLFLSIMVLAAYRGIRKRKIPATGSLISLLVFAFASYPFSVLPFLIGLVFLLAWIANPERISNTDEKFKTYRKIEKNKVLSLVLVLVCSFTTGYCIYTVYPVKTAYQSWNQSKALYHSGIYEEASKASEKIYSLLSDQVPFLFEYAQSLSKSGQYEASNRVLQKAVRIGCDPMLYNIMGKNHQAMKQYEEAEKCFLKATRIVPNRMYPYYLLAKMYLESGQSEKAGNMASIVLKKEPKVHSRAIEEMRKEMKKLEIRN